MQPPPAAFVYVPPDTKGDALYAHLGVAHIERHGYRLAGVARSSDHADRILAAGVEIVVFARGEHCTDAWPGLRVEIVGEETRRLTVHRADNRREPAGSLANEVAAYRSGYADGYVDSITLRGVS